MRISRIVSVLAASILATLAAASPAFAETHPFVSSFGSFANPNGIAVEESTGDVYVADIATGAVSRFDASGNPVSFPALGTNVLTGSATPAGSFAFPEASGTPAAIAVDNSTSPSDPSAGDLYVMDAGHEAIDKFNAKGEYLNQIAGHFSAGPLPGELVAFAIEASGDIRVADNRPHIQNGGEPNQLWELFDNSASNNLISTAPGVRTAFPVRHGFAVGPEGDSYVLDGEGPCGCFTKWGGRLGGGLPRDAGAIGLGQVDLGPGGVASAVDPVSGHLYLDDQSSVAEWDTGAMNGPQLALHSNETVSTGTLVSSFGSMQLASSPAEQGGIAVDGASGKIYVSNSADGKVYVFATTTPAVAAGDTANLSQTGATLQGSVNPRGVPVTSCSFEYEGLPEGGEYTEENLPIPVTIFGHSVPCVTEDGTPIRAGSSPVAVHADLSGLTPGTLYDFRLVAGNAAGVSPSEGRFPTVGSGFGIKTLEVAFLNQDGTPDTQAGSHPYEMVTSFTFKTAVKRHIASMDSPYLTAPDGAPKDISLLLPPGFVGDPDASESKCTLSEIEGGFQQESGASCPPGSVLGILNVKTNSYHVEEPVFNMVPPRGVAVQLGANLRVPKAFIDVGVQTGGDYPVHAESLEIPQVEAIRKLVTTLFGVVGSGEHRKPFLTLPTGCTGPLKSTISADSWQDQGHYVSVSSVTHDLSGQPLPLTGCSKLTFPPTIAVAPDITTASSSSGLTVGVHVPQTAALNPDGLAESALRDTTVALPAGLSINPAGADGLEACSEGLAGFMGFQAFNPEFEPGVRTVTFSPAPIESLRPGVDFCPDGSKIGTVKIKTPLLPNALEGAVYLAAQDENPFGSLIAMYMMVEDPVSGSTVKLAGEVQVCEGAGQVVNGVSCLGPGQLVTTFKNTPDLPFEDLELHFFGGERAPLRTPSRCGTYTTQASFTPWDGNAPVNTSSSFQITSGPNGSPCPGASLPFNPSLTAGTTSNQAGGFSPFTMTMSRPDGSQNLQAVGLRMPAGLSGLLTGVELCPEPQASQGLCGPGSLIGETTVSVGVGGKPFSVKGGRVYLTGPYQGAPFGLSIVNPAKAGPYDLEKGSACDCVVVRARIEVDPLTAALTVTSDNGGPFKIPTILKGIPLEIQHVNVTINRPGFTFNPTSCNPMSITGSLSSTEGASQALSVPFQATNCAALAFAPKLAVSTSGKTSKANGASLSVRLTYPKAPFGSQANIKQVKVELPEQLPSRLTTLQKACTAAQFKANPAGCPVASVVGHAKAITPLLPVPLEGPAYFVSNGGEAFPNLIVVLQGYGVRIDLVGDTFISKAGVTSSTFKTVPDAPVGSFELTLPQGRFSALTANADLCAPTRTVLVKKKKVKVMIRGHKHTVTRQVRETQPMPLSMPTEFIAQNGAVIHQTTPINVTGCVKSKPAPKAKAKKGHKKK